MLTHLSVQNFTLVDRLELEVDPGMTAITGETGAGKSIILDALGLTLGDRAESDRVRAGRARADICATFDVSAIKHAQHWLAEHDLSTDDECLLRRVVTKEGRSRGYINGQPVPLTQLRQLGEMLIDIHSQHAHQSLLHKDTHRRLLDDFGGHQKLARQCRQEFKDWQAAKQRYEELRDNVEEAGARLQLLRYQVQELEALELQEGELQQLETEQKQLANAETILGNCQAIVQLCNDDEMGLTSGIHRAVHLLGQLGDKPQALASAEELLQSAQIQIQEAQSELDHYVDSFELDPMRLREVEDRLSSCYDIARKHRISPEELLDLQQRLSEELAMLDGGDEMLDKLQADATAARDAFMESARKLTRKRQAAAKKLQTAINAQLQELVMKNAKVAIELDTDENNAGSQGLDDIEFLVSTNPGQPPKSLAKIASGGELSRISLAIQVVTAQSSTTPTLVFDEVDVGIGGATADVVGQLLRRLGQQGQVICVTHLPQVASKGHQHLLVHKETDSQSAQSTLTPIEGDEKIMEIARMMGGQELTRQTIAHAREMLDLAAQETKEAQKEPA
ncbi:DNA repair protein RecN [Pseudomaricurvus alkylphenolicus]|uniref:DNA repair protein RecN n=1 Tax=Pseudomaricurvus alkylphenolicus TaxID=1306991 RepID=UPI00141FD90D|nr:DNA repair protein RecN [Pseudomaricurvus alkylphenolicus]NIB44609.1 DNA repair protein RecN [Pseudomaricurvus alkylphenolicus]